MISSLPPGWYAQLLGDITDLEDWAFDLKPPFDPVVQKDSDGTFIISSKEFASEQDATDVREKAVALIARLNGAMAATQMSRSVKCGAIYKVDHDGKRHVTVFAEMASFELGRCVLRATAIVMGPDGKPMPPPPPQQSKVQIWNEIAAQDDNVADLLEQYGNSDGWYDIYKTLELAEHIVGGKHKLENLLGENLREFRNLRQTANYYRHARATRPVTMTSPTDAKALLKFIVCLVMDSKSG